MKIILDSYTGSLVHLGVNKKEKIMKSRSFKTRKDMIDYLQKGGDYKGVPKIKKVKCGMDSLVDKLWDDEAKYWEMKAEIHYGI